MGGSHRLWTPTMEFGGIAMLGLVVFCGMTFVARPYEPQHPVTATDFPETQKPQNQLWQRLAVTIVQLPAFDETTQFSQLPSGRKDPEKTVMLSLITRLRGGYLA